MIEPGQPSHRPFAPWSTEVPMRSAGQVAQTIAYRLSRARHHWTHSVTVLAFSQGRTNARFWPQSPACRRLAREMAAGEPCQHDGMGIAALFPMMVKMLPRNLSRGPFRRDFADGADPAMRVLSATVPQMFVLREHDLPLPSRACSTGPADP